MRRVLRNEYRIFIEFKRPDFICFYGKGGVEEITSAFSFPFV